MAWRGMIAGHRGEGTTSEDVVVLALRAAEVLERLGDRSRLAAVLDIAGRNEFYRGRAQEGLDVLARALEVALEAGDVFRARYALQWSIGAMGFGPTPVTEIYSYLETVPDVVRSGIEVEMAFHLLDAQMFGYTGRFDEARESFRLGRRSLFELGRRTHFVGMAMFLGQIELAAGELEAAEQVFREGYDGLGELGETGYRSTMTTMLADTLVRLGRIDEADDLLEVAAELSLADDADPQVRMRWVRGKVLAERGDLAEGERVAREAVSLASATDYLVLHGDALLALADVLVTAGKDDEALAALHDAVELYDRKEATALAATARGRIEALL